jgi:hypothetical protein
MDLISVLSCHAGTLKTETQAINRWQESHRRSHEKAGAAFYTAAKQAEEAAPAAPKQPAPANMATKPAVKKAVKRSAPVTAQPTAAAEATAWSTSVTWFDCLTANQAASSV